MRTLHFSGVILRMEDLAVNSWLVLNHVRLVWKGRVLGCMLVMLWLMGCTKLLFKRLVTHDNRFIIFFVVYVICIIRIISKTFIFWVNNNYLFALLLSYVRLLNHIKLVKVNIQMELLVFFTIEIIIPHWYKLIIHLQSIDYILNLARLIVINGIVISIYFILKRQICFFFISFRVLLLLLRHRLLLLFSL